MTSAPTLDLPIVASHRIAPQSQNSRGVALLFATYNNAATAAQCLKSCLSQDYADLQIIAADDGSSDETREALEREANGDPRFTLLALPHGERGVARAAATQKAKELGVGFLYILDSDMMLQPGLVSSCVAYLDKNSRIGGLAIPEIPFSGSSNWMSRVKVFERRVMNNAGRALGRNSIEAARFWRLSSYESTGGINPAQIAFEETQPTIRFLESGGRLSRATFTGVRHDEKHVTMSNLLEKKRYYFSVMDKTLSSESGGIWKAISRSYFFRPVLYRRQNLALYARHPLLAGGMGWMYVVLSFYAVLDILSGMRKSRAA